MFGTSTFKILTTALYVWKYRNLFAEAWSALTSNLNFGLTPTHNLLITSYLPTYNLFFNIYAWHSFFHGIFQTSKISLQITQPSPCSYYGIYFSSVQTVAVHTYIGIYEFMKFCTKLRVAAFFLFLHCRTVLFTLYFY